MKQAIIYILSFLGIISQMSCDDQLNALPTQSKVVGNVIVDQKSAEVALNGVYYRFAQGGDDRNTPSILWGYAQEITPAYLSGYITRTYGGSYDENAEVSSADYGVSGMWSYHYTLINAANGVITQMEPLPASMFTNERKAEIIAEAKLMRAFGHYNLLRYFTQFYDTKSEFGALLRDEFITPDNIAKQRSNVAATYALILEDLEEAIKNTPLENKNIYGNRWIAKALKSRVLIMRGETTDYEEVISLTSDIIEHGPYELEEHVRDIFQEKGLTSKEVMLGIQPLANQVKRHDTYLYNNSTEYKATPLFLELLKDDPREEWIIGKLNDKDTIYAITKYVGDKIEECYAMRLTEMYLLKAEAMVRGGKDIDEAKELLKTIMEHAGITDFTKLDAITDRDELLFEIYKETVKNLMFEDGIEWSALIRFPIETILKVKPAIREKNYIILPIPADEFEKNPTVGDQNPGYSKI
ncbi:RagB/SusD family nutrient uptake outer membrane protein [Butyricimonas faecalis]|uniref:RagB/SusD family nutrient uptake outer membrane protein n=1 Tax=Butyricimonas faecalis TaxID=2093856 RepID=A0A3S9VYK3_9BACT|nr:RagB/SusD family nutrient uptake outer membrane protein [Butyricimonas faecalis]AZS31625.1 RagB/SusD family nutrient uptake outer membrane protein [Butyricimonas faecalis]